MKNKLENNVVLVEGGVGNIGSLYLNDIGYVY